MTDTPNPPQPSDHARDLVLTLEHWYLDRDLTKNTMDTIFDNRIDARIALLAYIAGLEADRRHLTAQRGRLRECLHWLDSEIIDDVGIVEVAAEATLIAGDFR